MCNDHKSPTDAQKSTLRFSSQKDNLNIRVINQTNCQWRCTLHSWRVTQIPEGDDVGQWRILKMVWTAFPLALIIFVPLALVMARGLRSPFWSCPMRGNFFFIEILDEPLERSPPVIVGDPQTHFRILEGASVKFRCPIVGSAPFRVEWSLVRHKSNHLSWHRTYIIKVSSIIDVLKKCTLHTLLILIVGKMNFFKWLF